MFFNKYIFSRGMPKTEQVTQYAAGDDGDLQKGWWLDRNIAGNKTRFVAVIRNGTTLVHDRATHLCWPHDWAGDGANNDVSVNWATAIAWAAGLVFAGFSDWRIPNYHEISSLMSMNQHSPSIPIAVFDNVGVTSFWTSSTWHGGTSYAIRTGANNDVMYWELKTNTSRCIAVRTYH